jgi:hypothetical protein
VAAAILTACTSIAVYYLFIAKKVGSDPRQASYATLLKDIHPGKDQARLLLADGTVMILDSTGAALTDQLKKAGVSSLDKGTISYGESSKSLSSAINILSTPRGGQFRIRLPDGTLVWLNAASSLSYPLCFTGADRLVHLYGEAYFEVVKDISHPFRVQVVPNSRDMIHNSPVEVFVLGTHFNISGYEEEGQYRTTLLEGAIRVKCGQAGDLVLQPGEQAALSSAGRLTLDKEADLTLALAWKNGFFSFDNMPVETIMQQLARWYDVEIDYRGDKTKKITMLQVRRSSSLDRLLKIMEMTGALHFTWEGRRLIVTR